MDATSRTLPGPAPRTVHELRERISSKRCTCEDISKNAKPCKHPHKKVFEVCNNKARIDRSYDAVELADQVIYFIESAGVEESRDQVQRIALQELKDMARFGWIDGKREVFRRLGWKNGKNSVSPYDMEMLIECLNELFFGSTLGVLFKWVEGLRDSDGRELYGCCSFMEDHILIRMDATFFDNIPNIPGKYYGRALSRLGTLLHEMLHAFFQQYACVDCARVKLGFGGHGLAWQMAGNKLEKVASQLFNAPIDLSRFNSYRCDWQHLQELPCGHWLDAWDWKEDLLRERVEDTETK
ncbi:hypothetical protein P154DRAFT_569971 [Amniculicola lignicola CBS 123094]|uniref:SprT-like domain-containing protein n=1 Tax=Amniculicola lignicola CBS 123094 TaxID=1392246 RepID=A0A6A5X2U7_9PLEO|nr:hypothetical protein P154DRAFT_569971 [Amniculicola lignicola CBS 123094]